MTVTYPEDEANNDEAGEDLKIVEIEIEVEYPPGYLVGDDMSYTIRFNLNRAFTGDEMRPMRRSTPSPMLGVRSMRQHLEIERAIETLPLPLETVHWYLEQARQGAVKAREGTRQQKQHVESVLTDLRSQL